MVALHVGGQSELLVGQKKNIVPNERARETGHTAVSIFEQVSLAVVHYF